MAIYQHICIYGIIYLDPEQKKIVCALWLILQWFFEQFHLKKGDKKCIKGYQVNMNNLLQFIALYLEVNTGSTNHF